MIGLTGSPSFCVGRVILSAKPATRLIRAGSAANFFLTHASEPARRLYLAGYKSEQARALVVSGKRVIFFLIYTHTKVDLAVRVTLFPGIISIHINECLLKLCEHKQPHSFFIHIVPPINHLRV